MKGFRTLIFGLIIAVGGVLQTFDWASVIPQDKTWSGAAMLAVGAAIVALRYITTSPILTNPNTTVPPPNPVTIKSGEKK